MSTTKTKPNTGQKPEKKAKRIPLPGSVQGLLRRQQVCDALGGCSERMLSKMITQGDFPKADTRLGRNPRWSVALVNEWCEAQRLKARG